MTIREYIMVLMAFCICGIIMFELYASYGMRIMILGTILCVGVFIGERLLKWQRRYD